MKKVTLLFLGIILTTLVKSQVGPVMNICLVTVDSNSTHNIVVWEKATQISVLPIDSVKIYRAAILGNDSLVGTVAWDSLSTFHDYSADPNLRAHRYRIAGVDSTGNEGPMSFPHQTIHFNVFDNGLGNLHLVWTPYIGEAVNFYDCWIDSAGSLPGWQWVNATSTDADTSWWDNATPSDWTNLTYLVDVNWNNQCSATKAQDHNSTRSNRSTMTSGSLGFSKAYDNSIMEFAIFPNPVLEQCTVVFSSTNWSEKLIKVVGASGKIVRVFEPFRVLGQHQMKIDLSAFESGVYQVIIQSDIDVYTKQFIKL